MLRVEPHPLGYKAVLALQVRLKGIKVCAQQSMSNHLQGGNLH